VQGFRLENGSGGASISHLTFSGLDLAVFVATGADVHDVVVSHCTFLGAIQAISAWGGSRWAITHNRIHDLRTRNGGGIGILIGDWNGRPVHDNLIAHNRIDGTLRVWANDGGG
jgi:hypothetical protein